MHYAHRLSSRWLVLPLISMPKFGWLGFISITAWSAMTESIPGGGSPWWSAIAAIAGAIATSFGTWITVRRAKRDKVVEGETDVTLARIARESSDRDQLISMLKEQVLDRGKRIAELETELEEERRRNGSEREEYQRRIWKLQRERGRVDLRIGGLLDFINRNNLVAPPPPTLDPFVEDDDLSRAPRSRPPLQE